MPIILNCQNLYEFSKYFVLREQQMLQFGAGRNNTVCNMSYDHYLFLSKHD